MTDLLSSDGAKSSPSGGKVDRFTFKGQEIVAGDLIQIEYVYKDKTHKQIGLLISFRQSDVNAWGNPWGWIKYWTNEGLVEHSIPMPGAGALPRGKAPAGDIEWSEYINSYKVTKLS